MITCESEVIDKKNTTTADTAMSDTPSVQAAPATCPPPGPGKPGEPADPKADLDHLKHLGQKGYAATWFTRAQRQVFWSSWAVRKRAVLEQVARHQLRREVARIQAAPDLTQLGQRLYQVQQAQPQRYSPAQWAALWYVYHGRKARPVVP